MRPASTALHALLQGLIDYAGLFPPARLDMAAAVAAYQRHLSGPEAFMLGRFVLPCARLDELASTLRAALGGVAPAAPWQLAVLAGAEDAAALHAFNRAQQGWAVVDVVEARAEDVASAAAVVNGLPAGFTVFVELPLEADLEALLPVLQRLGGRAKIRTGGLAPAMFPATRSLAGFVEACIRHGVPCKATAGLHHPLRGSHPLDPHPAYGGEACHTMHGFINLFLAAALLRDGASADEAALLLEETSWEGFTFDSEAITWRGRRITVSRILDTRAHSLTSFGSCSFDEPVAELQAQHLL